MKKHKLPLAILAALLLVAVPASAEIGTLDQVPAATLLLPYFEVPLDAPMTTWGYPNTTFTIGNSSATAILAHVTLWTDLGVPNHTLDVYLTGYDVEVINLRLLFLGIPPVHGRPRRRPDGTASATKG